MDQKNCSRALDIAEDGRTVRLAEAQAEDGNVKTVLGTYEMAYEEDFNGEEIEV